MRIPPYYVPIKILGKEYVDYVSYKSQLKEAYEAINDLEEYNSALKEQIENENKNIKIKKLEEDLKYKDGTKMFDTLMANSSGEAKELLARHCYKYLKCVLVWEEDSVAEHPQNPQDPHDYEKELKKLNDTIDVLVDKIAALRKPEVS